MKKRGVPMNHIAQQISQEDLIIFDHILCMDESNLRDLNRKKVIKVKTIKAKTELLGNYDLQKQNSTSGMTLMFRQYTSKIPGTAERSWRRPTKEWSIP